MPARGGIFLVNRLSKLSTPGYGVDSSQRYGRTGASGMSPPLVGLGRQFPCAEEVLKGVAVHGDDRNRAVLGNAQRPPSAVVNNGVAVRLDPFLFLFHCLTPPYIAWRGGGNAKSSFPARKLY